MGDTSPTQLRTRPPESGQPRLADDAQLFRRIFQHSHDAIFVVDPAEDRILRANERATRLLGYSQEEFETLPLSAIHPHELEKFRGFAEQVRELGAGWTDQLTCRRKDGHCVETEISASLSTLDGRPHIICMVRDISERRQLVRENDYLKAELDTHSEPIVGNSPALRAVLAQVARVAPTTAPVLLTGESGTGKELIAQAVHRGSRRSGQPLVRVNCAAIPERLAESEFFGHVRGAFTGARSDRRGRFELADGGTIFLDEIGELTLELQAKLLRVLQEGQLERLGESRTRKVDVRIIAATNRNLRAEMAAGRFREDLYFRLNVVPIEVPPLRARGADIALLARHAIRTTCDRLSLPRVGLTEEQTALLVAYPWPGNIRELQNIVARAVILGQGSGRLELDKSTLEPEIPAGAGTAEGIMTLDDIKKLERDVIEAALDASDWKIRGEQGAAQRLGIPPTTLASRMKRLGLERPRGVR